MPTLKRPLTDADGNDAMSLRIALLLALAVLAATAAPFLPATTAGAASLGGWNLGEQRATDAITRAEAAHLLAVALKWQGGGAQAARDLFSQFVLPRYTAAQKRILQLAVSRIGMPYIRGGETDGGQERGGYDCSGLVWRVFKLSGFSWGRQIRGRTAASQAWMIHSSDQGVYVPPLRLDTWRAKRFSWARRVL
jgi:cell wall-associated NlpC family hydrolase